MKPGDLVKVRFEDYGIELGVLVKKLRLRDEHWQVKMFNHPRDIFAMPNDLEVISESR